MPKAKSEDHVRVVAILRYSSFPHDLDRSPHLSEAHDIAKSGCMVNAFAFSDILGKPSGTPCFGRNGAPDKWCSRSWSGGYGTLLEHGLAARLAVERQAVTPAVEKVVEANTLLSGLGSESGGLGVAHPIHNGLTALEGTHHYWHGEKVAFGIIAMIMLEERRAEVLAEVVDFCLEVGLPATLSTSSPFRTPLVHKEQK